MDIKKKADVQPKKFERTVKIVKRTARTVGQVEKSIRGSTETKKKIENQMRSKNENESSYASSSIMRAGKDVRKKTIKASYKAIKRLYRWNKNRAYLLPRVKNRAETESTLKLNSKTARSGKEWKNITRNRLKIIDGNKIQKYTYRRRAIKNQVESFQKATRFAKRGFETVVNSIASVIRAGKAIWMIISVAGGQVALVACVIALIGAILSPFAFLFSGNENVKQYPSLAEVASDINAEYTARFNKIIADHDDVDDVEIVDFEIDSNIYVASNWKDILSVWSINNDIYKGKPKSKDEVDEVISEESANHDDLPYVMTDRNITSLTNMFWEFNDISYKIKTEEVENDPKATVKPQHTVGPNPAPSQSPEPSPSTRTVRTLIITPVSKNYLWGSDKYQFNDEQNSWLEELMSDTYSKEWAKLLLGIVGTEMTETQVALIDNLKGDGAIIAYNASTRLGHPYSREKRGQGLYVDCSYFARWCYREAGYNWFTPGTAAEQGRWCNDNGYVIDKNKLQTGDLIFYSFAKNGRYKNISHVAVYIGRGADGKEYVIDASGSNGCVVYRELYSTGNIVLCGRPLMHLKNKGK